MAKKILWFLEHYEREMPIIELCLKRLYAEGLDAEIQLSLLNFPDISIYGKRYNAIVLPSKNRLLKTLLKDVDIPIICLNYEQMLSWINNSLKTPDALIKQAEYLISWSEQFSDYLKVKGIDQNAIIHTQRPQNEIARQNLSQQVYDVPPVVADAKGKFSNIIYLPLTCLQAFKTDSELRRLAKSTGVEKSYLVARKRAVKNQLISLYTEIEKTKESFFIVRPHPGVTTADHTSLLKEIGLFELENLLITDDGNAYDWLNVSDIVVTNYSSVLLDAQAVNKECYLFRTDQLPQWMRYDWFEDFRVIQSFDESSLAKVKKIGKPRKASAYPENSEALTAILKQSIQKKAVLLSKKRLYFLICSTRFWADVLRLIIVRSGLSGIKVKKDYESYKTHTR